MARKRKNVDDEEYRPDPEEAVNEEEQVYYDRPKRPRKASAGDKKILIDSSSPSPSSAEKAKKRRSSSSSSASGADAEAPPPPPAPSSPSINSRMLLEEGASGGEKEKEKEMEKKEGDGEGSSANKGKEKKKKKQEEEEEAEEVGSKKGKKVKKGKEVEGKSGKNSKKIKGKEKVQLGLTQWRKDAIMTRYGLDPPRPLSLRNERWLRKCAKACSAIELLTQQVYMEEAWMPEEGEAEAWTVDSDSDSEIDVKEIYADGVRSLPFSKFLVTPNLIDEEVDTKPGAVLFVEPSKQLSCEATLINEDGNNLYRLKLRGARRLKIENACTYQLWSFRDSDSTLGIALIQLGTWRRNHKAEPGRAFI